MIVLKIFKLICLGLILSTCIVEGKGRISSGSKSRSSSSSSKSYGSSSSSKSYGSSHGSSHGSSWGSSGSSSSNRKTTSRPFTTSRPYTTSRPIIKQTARPVETHRYPTQPAYNPYYNSQPQPNFPQSRPNYPQSQPNFPQSQPNYPQTYYPNQNQYPHHSYPSWGNQPQKSKVGQNIATHAIAGLGGAYVGHQIGKHESWYEKRRRERERERELEWERERNYNRDQGYSGTHTGHRTHYNDEKHYSDGTHHSGGVHHKDGKYTPKNRTNTFGLDKLTPINPFKVNDISGGIDAQNAAGNGLTMKNDALTRYKDDPQINEISKAADANAYLNMKLRPSKSETIPKKNYTTEQLQTMMVAGGGAALIGGALGASAMGTRLPVAIGTTNLVNQTGGAAVPQSGAAATMTFDPNSQNPFSPLMPVNVTQPGGTPAQTTFTITGGQSILPTNQTQTPYKIPLVDPQVLPLVMQQLETDEKLHRATQSTSGSGSMYIISNSLIIISIVAIKKFY